MKIATQRQDDCTLTLTVEVEDARVQPALRAAARQLAKQYPIPGFRPGKAPYETIVRQFGEGAVYESALEDLGQRVYKEVLEQEHIDAYGPGALQDVQLKPLVLTFSVPLRPEVDLGDYRALRVPYTPPAVGDEAVAEAMEHLREHHAILEPVERAAALGDVVVLDAKGYLHQGENPSDFLLADQDVALLLDEKTDWPMPGFAPHILGLQAGDEKKFDLTFPEDFANASLRGQVAHFEVVVKEVKSRTLPEWSDELAKDIGDYENLEALRARVRENLAREAEREVEDEYHRHVMDQLVEQASVKYPPALLDSEVDELLDDLDHRLREQRLTLDDYLKIEGKTKDDLREEYRPQAERRLKRALVLGKVVDLEQLEVGDEEVEGQITRLSAPWGERSGQIRRLFTSERARETLISDMLTDKALKRLAAIARGEDVPPPAQAETASSAVEADTETAPVADTEAETSA